MELLKLWHKTLVLRSSGSLRRSDPGIQLILFITHLSLWGRHLSAESFAFTRSLGGDCNLFLLLWCGVSIHAQGSPVLSVGLDAGVCSINGVLRLETPLEDFGAVRRILVHRVVHLASGGDRDPELFGVLVRRLFDVLDLLGLVRFVGNGGVLLRQLQVLVAAMGDFLRCGFRHLFAHGHRHAAFNRLVHLHRISMRHVHRVHCLVEILILGTFELVLVFVDHGVQVDVNCLQRFLLPFGIEVGRPSEFLPGFRG